MTTCLEKRCFMRYIVCVGRESVSFCVCAYVPFGFEGGMWDLILLVPDHGMWDLILLVPDHCQSFYLLGY